MQNHFNANNRLASIGTVGLLFVAGIAGMVFLLPVLPAHAATSVTLSAASGTVGSYVTITGTGFKPSADVAIEFGTTLVNTFGQASPYPTIATLLDTATNSPNLSSPTPLGISGCGANLGTGSSTPGPCILTDANGFFSAVIAVPPTVNGLQTVTVADGTNTGTSTFTVSASLQLLKSISSTSVLSSGLPDETFPNTVMVASGLAASDTVTFTSPAFGTTSPFGTTSAAGTAPATPTPETAAVVSSSGVLYIAGPGIASVSTPVTVTDVLGGKQTIIGTSSSGLTPSTSFTINPVIALYASQLGTQTVFSMNAAATSAIFVGGMGFAAGTIAANSITIAGTSVTHPQVSVSATGAFGMGAGAHVLLVSGAGGVPAGPASMVIVDGANTYTFNYASHNIVNGLHNGAAGIDSSGQAIPDVNAYPGYSTSSTTPEAVTTTGEVPYGYGAPLIVSSGGSASSVATLALDSSSYQPNNKAFVTVIGSGFCAVSCAAGNVVVTLPAITGGTALTFGTPVVDSNGAFWMLGDGAAAPTPSSSCTKTTTGAFGQAPAGTLYCLNEEPYPSQSPTPATGYALSVTAPTVAAVQAPTLNIQPYISPSSTTLSFGSAWPKVTFHGFTASNTCTLAAAGTAITFISLCNINTNGTRTDTIGPNGLTAASPDLPGGLQTLTGSDGVTTGTAQAFVLPVMLTGSANALSPNNGASGTTSILRSGSNYGVHGLAASTAYTIVWDPTQATETSLGSFTSTSNGNIPAGGVQFTIPAGQSGLHTVGLKSGSTYVFFNVISTSTLSPPASEQAGATNSPDASNNVAGSLSRGQYGDGVFSVGASLTAVPTVANVGGTIGITGTGLAANTIYDLSTGAAVNGNCGNVVGNALSGTFTASSTGSVPSGTSVSVSDTPTYAVTGVNSPEQGSLYCIAVSTPSQFQLGGVNNPQAGEASFILEASANLNMTSAPIGHNVVITAHGLLQSTAYNILFNPSISSGGVISGQVIGAVLSNAFGAATGTLTVPNVATGAYSIQLQQIGKGMNAALATPPTITVGGNSQNCQTTGCLVATGSPSETTIGPNKAVQTSFTNNSNAPVTAIIYAVVHNAAGQTVAYSTATLTNVPAGQSATAYDILFGLAPGSYSVTIFATSTSGTAISTTSTVTVTI